MRTVKKTGTVSNRTTSFAAGGRKKSGNPRGSPDMKAGN
jgi:hypothetical protein